MFIWVVHFYNFVRLSIVLNLSFQIALNVHFIPDAEFPIIIIIIKGAKYC